MSLYPTKTRLALLCQVEQSLVWRSTDGEAYIGSSTTRQQARMVTARVDELARQGWIRLRLPTSAVYALTEAGRAVLAAGGVPC